MIANCTTCGHKSDTLAQKFQNERYQGARVFTEKLKEIRKCTCCGTQGTGSGSSEKKAEAKK